MIYKLNTCNKIGHLTKSCKLRAKLCPKCNSTICPGTCPKSIGNVSIVEEIIVLLIRDALHSNHPFQNTWIEDKIYTPAVCRRTAKEEVEAFIVNIVINIQQLTKIINSTVGS